MDEKNKDNQQARDSGSQEPLPELQAKVASLPHIPKETGASNSEETEKVGVKQEVLLAERLEYTKVVHEYVNEYIRFADTKAGFIFGLISASVGFLYSKAVMDTWTKSCIFNWTFSDYIAFVGSMTLFVAGFASFWVVKPRLRPRKNGGLIFWETVASRVDANGYVGEVTSLTGGNMISEIVDHTYQLSKVAQFKYRWLNISILFTGISALVWVVFFLVS